MTIYNLYNHKVFGAYVQQRTPAAYRIFYAERLNKVVIARSKALHRMVYRAQRRAIP